jgi:hypothetical protein
MEYSSPSDYDPANRTYLDGMALAPAVARARFARFVERALRDARERGLNDPEIRRLTGIPPSTFHRWQSGEGGLPRLEKVQAFCVGLEIPPQAALAALGVEDAPPGPTEPTLDPDIRRIARILADPGVGEAEKQAIRHTIRMLGRAAQPEPALDQESEPVD